ncbi:rhophilin-2-like [Antedon mediterranea]|uniref:rhophilin-2-like n=1 Tax=Antedon mediterranea TaxID=105859 RepID=UPI003AF46B3A
MHGEGQDTLRKGTDPTLQSVRGRMQNRRQKLNQKINKEMRMRAGAENLYKAASNKKLKEQVALELSFVNSNLQLLKEELAEINSDVIPYQTDSFMQSVPMIPLGFKETNDVDVKQAFKDYILEHYSEEDERFSKEISDFLQLRQAIKTPSRNDAGVELLLEYYNQLYFIEHRFFPPNRHLGIYFHWYDALTGVPSVQRSVAFEKGSVLFNVGALYTQLGSKQDRSQIEGINKVVVYFEKAAGAFRYLSENFSHAPSMDMSAPVLDMFVNLMLGQVQEAVFERRVLGGVDCEVQTCIEVAKEAAKVSTSYSNVHKAMMHTQVKDYIPYAWISMVLVKSQHFKALSHYYIAVALIGQKAGTDYDIEKLRELFSEIHLDAEKEKLPEDHESRKRLGKAHVKQAVMLHEEALRVHNLSKTLRKIDTLQEVLKHAHTRSIEFFSKLDEEDDFFDIMEVPAIKGKTCYQPSMILPDFAKVKVKDIFHSLGPLAIFNARNSWSAPREVVITRGSEGFGFTVRGDSPVIIASVDANGPALRAGVNEGDFIVRVEDNDVKWAKHDQVVKHILSSPGKLTMSIVTALEDSFIHPQDQRRLNGTSPVNGETTNENSTTIDRKNKKGFLQSKNGSIPESTLDRKNKKAPKVPPPVISKTGTGKKKEKDKKSGKKGKSVDATVLGDKPQALW